MRVVLYALRILASLTAYVLFMPLLVLLVLSLWVIVWAQE